MVFSKFFRRASADATRPAPKSSQQSPSDLKSCSEQALESLLSEAPKSARPEIRQELLGRLLKGGSIPAAADDALLVRIVAFADDTEIAQAALNRITDEAARARLAREHSIARIRLLAAATLSGSELLHTVMQSAQGSDKAVYRLCKDRLHEQQQAEAEQQQQLQRLQQLQEQLAHLIGHPDSPDFAGRFQVLSQRWQDVQSFPEGFNPAPVEALLTQAAALEQSRRQAEAEQQAAAAAATERQTILKRLKAALGNADQASGTWSSLLEAEQQAWRSASGPHLPAAKEQQAFDQLLETATRVLQALRAHEALQSAADPTAEAVTPEDAATDQIPAADSAQQAREWLQQISWPEAAATPVWLQQLQSRAQVREVRTEIEKPARLKEPGRDPELLQQLNTLSASMEAALDEGNAGEAGRCEKRLQKLLDQLSPQARHKVQGSVRLLSGRLHELRDWQGFAVTPKKEALCAEMEALSTSPAGDPESRADQIKTLQQAWKDLGYSGNDRDLWERFRAAADTAFEPCRIFYEEQAQQRAAMVSARENLIAELTGYESAMNWETADWKTVQATLDAAREAFRQAGPVDHKAHTRTQKAFRDICDRIYAHLKGEYDRNLNLKRTLVEKAAAATENADVHAAADTIKQLQQEWKSIGMTPRAADQKLWSELRSHADAVFARLGEQRQARKQVLDETVAQGEALLKTAADALSNNPATASAQLDECAAGLAQLDLPKSAAQRLGAELSHLRQQQTDALNRKASEQNRASWQSLLSWLENPAVTDIPASGELPQGIGADWFAGDTAATLDAQEICIRMEILADQNSPENEQEARMAVQVKRLAEGLGRGISPEEERAQLIREWLALTPQEAVMCSRFCAALKQSLN